jgi:hypothetical protein
LVLFLYPLTRRLPKRRCFCSLVCIRTNSIKKFFKINHHFYKLVSDSPNELLIISCIIWFYHVAEYVVFHSERFQTLLKSSIVSFDACLSLFKFGFLNYILFGTVLLAVFGLGIINKFILNNKITENGYQIITL